MNNPYLFVSGFILYGSYMYGYIIKYKRKDGSHAASAMYVKGSSLLTIVQTLFLDSDGNLIFGGDYGSSGVYTVWFGTVDKSTLTLSEHTISPPCTASTYNYIYKITEDSGSYIIAGGCGVKYLWVSV